MSATEAAPAPPQADPGKRPLHRSGAVARMLRMPVATLRVWERRYGVSQADLSPGGQRLYSDEDVQRLALLKTLTERGHAIGSLARLDVAGLRRVAATHARALEATQARDRAVTPSEPTGRTWQLAVIGDALAARLRRPALLRLLGRPVALHGPFSDAAQAATALQATAVDALLFHEPQLHDGWLARLGVLAPALAALPKAVLYRFAADPVCESLAAAGTALLREPQPDAVLAQWLQSFAGRAVPPPHDPRRGVSVDEPLPTRRWDDATLADFAGLSSTIACECPRHVAELLVQLSHFETYSAECAHRHASDAELHAHLKRVAAASRIRFESALEHIALHEGLILP